VANDPLYLRAGDLRHSVEIQTASPTRDAAGQPVSTWNVVMTTRAMIENSGARAYKESFSNSSLAAQSTDLLTIRWPGSAITVAPGMRIIYGNNTFLVQDVDNVLHRNRVVRLACLMIDEDSN
jgi:head-tail adaptor